VTSSEADGSRTVHVGPARVRIRTQGTGEPLVLLMGIGGHLDMWQPLTERLLLPGRQLVSFDFPGTGASSLPWFPPTMAHSALFVRLLMRKLGLSRADVLGYSWGGLLAQQLAAQHPRVVRRLVLACTGPGVLCVPADLRVAARLLTPRRYYSPDYLRKIAADTYGGRFRRDPKLVDGEVAARMSHPPSWPGYAFQLVAASTFSTFAVAPLIKSDALILGGGDDPIVKTKNQLILHRLIKGSALQIVEEAGHLVLLDSPEKMAPIIDGFLTNPPQ
jgi:pimeloyl-ACP methyl ester carboxylesterase